MHKNRQQTTHKSRFQDANVIRRLKCMKQGFKLGLPPERSEAVFHEFEAKKHHANAEYSQRHIAELFLLQKQPTKGAQANDREAIFSDVQGQHPACDRRADVGAHDDADSSVQRH